MENLDCMTPDELRNFWREHNQCGWQRARKLFPGRPDGYIDVTYSLALYAEQKAEAMKHRASGNIERALMHERSCERIYAELPEFARW